MNRPLTKGENSVTGKAMVKSANSEEEVLAVIAEMRKDNLTARQQKYISEYRNLAMISFRRIIYKETGLSDEQILDLSDQRIETLFKIVVTKAQKKLWYHYPLHVFPITLFFIAAANNGWHPNFNLAWSFRRLNSAGDRPITGADIRQSIIDYEHNSAYPAQIRKRQSGLDDRRKEELAKRGPA